MTATSLAAPVAGVAEGRIVSLERVRGMGGFLLVLAVADIFAFVLDVNARDKATFILSTPPAVSVRPWTVPIQDVGIAVAVVCAAVGAWLLAGRQRRGIYLVFTVGVLVFIFGFLAWAARNNSLPLTQVLGETFVSATPLLYGSLSGIMCERSGVVNIAIEGQFLAGAFLGAMVGSATGNLWVGVLAGAASGAVLGTLLAFLALRYGADQIIVGVVIVAFCTGLTNFLTEQVLSKHQNLNTGNTFSPLRIPLLSKIPVIGPALFDQNVFLYGAVILLVAIHVALFHTRWGLRVRAVGEHPQAAATVGLKVKRTRYRNVIIGGVIAGIGGASFTIGSVGEFNAGMTAGLGYVALAAMIFGRWRPFGALSAALLFGFAEGLQTFLALLNVPIPSPFLSMAPYVITILVVTGLVGRVRPPAADGVPYLAE